MGSPETPSQQSRRERALTDVKPSLFEFAKLALRGGAPSDIAEYTWTECRRDDGSSDAGSPSPESRDISPNMVTHTIASGVMSVGWDKLSRRAIWTWEPRLD
jgi:hypothetical protein